MEMSTIMVHEIQLGGRRTAGKRHSGVSVNGPLSVRNETCSEKLTLKRLNNDQTI